MKNIFCVVFLLASIAINAFENENSALNFAWDYARKNIEPEGPIGYRIGVLTQNVEFIVNVNITVLPPEEPQVFLDTIYIPQDNYVIGIEKNIGHFGGCQPYTLLFLSKKDSSYSAVESCGDFLNGYNCDIPFQNMMTRVSVVDTLLSNLDDFINGGACNVYMLDDIASDTLEISPYWQFLIERGSDGGAVSVAFSKELGIENKWYYSSEVISYPDSIVGYSLVYSRQDGAVGDIDSEFLYEIYPNPTSTFVNVCLEGSSVCLYSIDGKKLKCEDSNKIDVSEYSSGNYLLKITKDDACRYQRLIIK